jgi:hypothetical protein
MLMCHQRLLPSHKGNSEARSFEKFDSTKFNLKAESNKLKALLAKNYREALTWSGRPGKAVAIVRLKERPRTR